METCRSHPRRIALTTLEGVNRELLSYPLLLTMRMRSYISHCICTYRMTELYIEPDTTFGRGLATSIRPTAFPDGGGADYLVPYGHSPMGCLAFRDISGGAKIVKSRQDSDDRASDTTGTAKSLQRTERTKEAK
ncbi:hypothetical protein Tco_0099622 [Tanacetum coccineum]